jgi:hypothetical protein
LSYQLKRVIITAAVSLAFYIGAAVIGTATVSAAPAAIHGCAVMRVTIDPAAMVRLIIASPSAGIANWWCAGWEKTLDSDAHPFDRFPGVPVHVFESAWPVELCMYRNRTDDVTVEVWATQRSRVPLLSAGMCRSFSAADWSKLPTVGLYP